MKIYHAIGPVMVLYASVVDAAPAVDFTRDVRPVLSENCFHCHGPDEKTREAKLRLDTREGVFRERKNGAVVIPEKPEESQLIDRITTADPDDIMPPPDSHKSLEAEEIAILTSWVKQGAEWSDHWAFVAPKPVAEADPDHLILTDLKNRELKMGDRAAPERLLRRLALDLTGLPPDLKDVAAFKAGVRSYESYVDEYLASPHYGEHMAHYWLDGARYSDTHGLQNDYFRGIWPYREWVVNAYNENMSFKEFTIRQMAGDLLEDPTEDDLIATGFLKCNASTHEGGIIREEYRMKYLKDRTETFSQVWLGLTAECAGCHDHKYDPITMTDYYALTAFFAGIDEPVMNGDNSLGGRKNPVLRLDRIPASGEQYEALFDPLPAPVSTFVQRVAMKDAVLEVPESTMTKSIVLWLRPGDKDAEIASQIDDSGAGWRLVLKDRKPVLEISARSAGKVRYVGKDALPEQKASHIGIVIDYKDDVPSIRMYLNRNILKYTTEGEVVALASEKGTAVRVLKGQSEPGAVVLDFRLFNAVFARSEIMKLGAPLNERLAGLLGEKVKSTKHLEPKFDTTMIAKEMDSPNKAFVLTRGSYDSPEGDALAANTFSALPAFPAGWEGNRLKLAEWLFLPEHPLTGRVAVNRLWRQLFGEGLVRTGNDFGNQGAPPENAALLDALAIDFARDWDVKRILKQLVMTDYYQQTAKTVPGRSSALRLRLDAEVVRDQALVIAGLLNPQVGGYPVRPYQPAGVWYAVGVEISDTKKYIPDSGANLYRRTLYTVHKRTASPPVMANFDAPTRQSCTTQRERTNTPLQALQLLNDTQFFEAARALARRVSGRNDPAASMFELATCRKPDSRELKLLHRKLAAFRRLASPDVNQVGELEADVDPGLVLLANMVLNLDEVICK